MSIRRAVSLAVQTSIIVALLWCGTLGRAYAQDPVLKWDQPRRMSDPETDAWAPTITSDLAGNVHVMWSQTMTDDSLAGEGDTLVYARWDGLQWSNAAEVLVSPHGAAEFPDLAVSPNGTLHVVWGTGGTNSDLMYAQAPACCADQVSQWSQPRLLDGPMNMQPAIKAGQQGQLYVAFASLETHNIIFDRSDDNGATWPVRVEIPGTSGAPDELPAYPRMAVDGRGRIHLVWSVLPWPGRFVMYTRSEDGGMTWEPPRVIDSYDRPEYSQLGFGPVWIDVEAVGDDEIHVIWDGAPTVERTHEWSKDGGQTWSTPEKLFPEVRGNGRSGWNDMVADSAGTLYAFSLGVTVMSPLAETWSDGQWSRSQSIGTRGSSELVRTALNGGNQLNVVWLDFNEKPQSVWYVHGTTTGPAVAGQALPTLTPTPVPTATLAPTPTVSPTAFPTTMPLDPVLRSGAGSGGNGTSGMVTPVLLAVVPTLLIIAMGFEMSMRRRKMS